MSLHSGIYIHIPYCRKACTYCDFYFSTQHASMPATVEAILLELEIRKDELKNTSVQSIYLGGGTPSLLLPADLDRIFKKIHSLYNTSQLKEITIETNPDDITPEILQAWKKTGINRLSIGLQSFVEEELRQMNRAHTAQQGIQSVKMAQEAGFHNITVDLIYGTPWKTASQWENDIQTVINLDVPHVSAYQLTVEPGTALSHLVDKNKLSPLPDDEVAQQFITLTEMLKTNSIYAYEVSNFSKPGFEAVHNSSYWQGLPYLGIGPSAHSYDGKTRKKNVANLHSWQQAIKNNTSWWEEEVLTEAERYNEFILTRLRTRKGFSEENLADFSYNIISHFKKVSQIALQHGHLQLQAGLLSIPNDQVLFTDRICSELFLIER